MAALVGVQRRNVLAKSASAANNALSELVTAMVDHPDDGERCLHVATAVRHLHEALDAAREAEGIGGY